MKTCFIYALSDPRTNKVRYVGWCKNMKRRLSQHISCEKDHTHKCRWIALLRDLGLKPAMELLAEVQIEKWAEAERVWIKFFRDIGADLTNATDGGDGTPGRVNSPEHRRLISLSNKGRKHSEETWAKVRASLLGNKRSLGRKLSEEHRAKVSASLLGNKRHLGKKLSAECRAKLSVARLGNKYNLGKCYGKSTREKISAAHGGGVGVPGINFRKDNGVFQVRTYMNGKRKYIGCFKALAEAQAALEHSHVERSGGLSES